MDTTHFAKVTSNMSWQTLYHIIIEQKKMSKKKLPYIVIAEIHISSEDFNILVENLKKCNYYYLKYTSLSRSTPQGIWQCILIKSADNSRNVLIYTAGTKLPLYASILM